MAWPFRPIVLDALNIGFSAHHQQQQGDDIPGEPVFNLCSVMQCVYRILKSYLLLLLEPATFGQLSDDDKGKLLTVLLRTSVAESAIRSQETRERDALQQFIDVCDRLLQPALPNDTVRPTTLLAARRHLQRQDVQLEPQSCSELWQQCSQLPPVFVLFEERKLQDMSQRGKIILKQLLSYKQYHFWSLLPVPPSACYGDRMLLDFAASKGAFVVSNDKFEEFEDADNDPLTSDAALDVVRNRVLNFTVSDDASYLYAGLRGIGAVGQTGDLTDALGDRISAVGCGQQTPAAATTTNVRSCGTQTENPEVLNVIFAWVDSLSDDAFRNILNSLTGPRPDDDDDIK